jgi:hypothetical protein
LVWTVAVAVPAVAFSMAVLGADEVLTSGIAGSARTHMTREIGGSCATHR